MDRKYSDIVSDIKELNDNVDTLKSVQFFGYDTTELKLVQTEDSYDETVTLLSGQRASFRIICFNNDIVFKIGYNQILFQLWVNNMSTPYYGESSGIGVFTPAMKREPIAPGSDAIEFEIINSSASTKTIFLKAFAISTYENGVVQSSIL